MRAKVELTQPTVPLKLTIHHELFATRPMIRATSLRCILTNMVVPRVEGELRTFTVVRAVALKPVSTGCATDCEEFTTLTFWLPPTATKRPDTQPITPFTLIWNHDESPFLPTTGYTSLRLIFKR